MLNIHDLNQAWLLGKWDELKTILHEDVVFETPGMLGRIRGREACLESFKTYREHAVTHSFEESHVQVHETAATAVVHFQFRIDYETKSGRFQETGRDLWVFTKENQQWQAIWRAQLKLEHEVA